VRRDHPLFGVNAGESYWLVSDSPQTRSGFDLSDRFLVRSEGGKEMVLFPDYGSSPVPGPPLPHQTVPFRMTSVHPQSSFNPDAFYFTAVILPGGTSNPAKSALKIGPYRSVLLRSTAGTIELVKNFAVDWVDAPLSGTWYLYARGLYVRTHKGEPVTDFYVSKDDTDEKLFRFDGQAIAPSVSGAMDTVIFVGDRGFADSGGYWHRGANTLWLYREGMQQALDLDIPERLRAEVKKEIQQSMQVPGSAFGTN
jgi:hypothetical protein